MERDLEAEQQQLEEVEELRKPPKGDMCPHCCTPVENFPYVDGLMTPARVWLECPSCGIVFVPKSVRDKKIAVAVKNIVTPPSLLVPAH